MATTRRQAREWAIQMLTAADLNPPDDVGEFMSGFWRELEELDPEDGGIEDSIGKRHRAFAEERVSGVLRALEAIDKKLIALLDKWDIYRLGTVERAVLRMGIWEIDNTDVPVPVVINEAIDLANWFSTPKSRPLINGILDKYAKSARAV